MVVQSIAASTNCSKGSLFTGNFGTYTSKCVYLCVCLRHTQWRRERALFSFTPCSVEAKWTAICVSHLFTLSALQPKCENESTAIWHENKTSSIPFPCLNSLVIQIKVCHNYFYSNPVKLNVEKDVQRSEMEKWTPRGTCWGFKREANLTIWPKDSQWGKEIQ